MLMLPIANNERYNVTRLTVETLRSIFHEIGGYTSYILLVRIPQT